MSDPTTGFRLSSQQRYLWLLHRDGSVYCTQCAVLLDGPLDKALLAQAIQQTIQRHSILRTTFQRAPGMTFPLQVVAHTGSGSWCEIDLCDLSARQQDDLVERLLRDERSRQFDFAHGLLLRIALLSLAASVHVMVLVLPAICADQWTLEQMVSEISQAYADGAPPAVGADDEVVQYVQYCDWQSELFEADDAEAGKAYWSSQPNSAGIVTLPLEGRLNETWVREDRPCSFSWTLHPDVVSRLVQLAQSAATSAATCLLACWQTLLWRLSGQPTISVATVFDGRAIEELRAVLGPFARCLPLQCSLLDGFRFTEVLAQVDGAAQDAEAWQDYFVADAPLEGSADPASLPIGFEFQAWPAQYRAGDLLLSVSQRFARLAPLKLKLLAIRQGEVARLALEYDPERFSHALIARLAGQLQALLEHAVTAPETPIGDLRLMSEQERQQLLVELNDTHMPYPPAPGVHRLFEDQVARTPDRIAIVCAGHELTYAELNRCANQLAHYLQARGVGPDVLVGLYLERLPDMLVGLLGILKAGGAYLPLDVGLPAERLGFMLQDARVPVLVMHQRLVETLPAHSAAIVCLDRDWDVIAQTSQANPAADVRPAHLAYVIYTSGSTGRPKGVMIPHHGLANYLRWCIDAYAVAEGQGTPVHSALGFDLTITSLFPALLVGQSATLLPEQEGIVALRDVLRAERDFSLVKITPSHLQLLAQWFSEGLAAGMPRAFIIGGEALFGDSLAFWQAHAAGVRLINEYGPTETVVGCCVYEVPPGATISGTVPIGRPIANTQLYLLDGNLQPVPTGVAGELYIGGSGLARGYLNRPDLTAERFVPNPFLKDEGGRMKDESDPSFILHPSSFILYRTGDLARYLPDGNIEFLGRNDRQEKVHGYRIELGEIEAALASHPAVRSAVVVVQRQGSRAQRLNAYVVPERGQAPSTSELRGFLLKQLPDYMVPVTFTLLQALPLTPNGKIDRRALPDPESTRPVLEVAYTAPRTEVEKTVAAIWRDVLQLEQVGIHDNFFDLGGHSFLMIQAAGLIQKAVAPGLTVMDLFEHPTINTLAEYIATRTAGVRESDRAVERATQQKDALNRRKRRAKEREKTNA